jgi:diacylglycerol kinase (ATP)
VNGSIYDFGALPRLALQPTSDRPYTVTRAPRVGARRLRLAGLISNPRSHRNIGGSIAALGRSDVIGAAPATRAELRDVLAMFASKDIDLLIIDGGDGTIRDVLTCAGDVWDSGWPDIAILPSGKTNALAVDLGLPDGWSLDAALAAGRQGHTVSRSPIEIEQRHTQSLAVRGFLFGAGAFVDATELAQQTHRAGAFNSIAVGLALAWGIGQTLFGRGTSAWRAGSRIGLGFDDRAVRMHDTRPDGTDDRYIMLASTLERLPLGLKPFGSQRPGLKLLVVDAPPRRLAMMLAPLLAGRETRALEKHGYHRVDASTVTIDTDTSFIHDGESFPRGQYVLRRAPALRFVVP